MECELYDPRHWEFGTALPKGSHIEQVNHPLWQGHTNTPSITSLIIDI